MLRHGAWLAAALALALTAPAAARRGGPPQMLGVDDAAPVRVASEYSVRRVLRRCVGPTGCASVLLESCDRCILAATREGGGFAISMRLGPPGPEYDLVDSRAGREHARIFSAADMVEIFAGYVNDGRLPFAGTIEREGE